ncbi:helix-hairpin-helix domain-containing protein [Halapricum desulfuricans]|uniref:Putative nucleic acid binding protein, containing HHH domain n=1 Tax=Halapricum desulfuricans TaxID=2841257 RepID=A0A897N5L0_9EURY|nr:helix-hairpin-helix domain-containing protein [Halapricum desulfuricans]QSG05646.1 putative nucleic acid binding protein, containing HHH domain [Halapricum desulfuricans]
MGLSDLFDRIKAALGLGGPRGQQSERRPPRTGDEPATDSPSEETTVTVEREPSTESEDAVKGTDTTGEAVEEADSSTTENTEAVEKGESESDERPSEQEPDEDGESGDRAGETELDQKPGAERGEAESSRETEPDEKTETAESSGETESDEPDAGEDLGTDEPTDVIKGIGSTYADRLADAGVETVADLAARDADALAEETGISEKRLQTWIERAKHR